MSHVAFDDLRIEDLRTEDGSIACPECGERHDDGSHTLYVCAGLDISISVELDATGSPWFITHSPSSDELSAVASLCCKACGWFAESGAVTEWLANALGDSQKYHLSSVTTEVEHPSLDVFNEG